jgi:hypothetical protein
MPDTSPLLALPLIQPAQAQKHVTHNSAIDRLDQLVQLVVEGFGVNAPPVAPAEGAVWALGAAPLGVWAGRAFSLASWRGGAWVFVTPAPGWRAWGRAEGALRVFAGGDWGPLLNAADLQNLAGVGINTAADATNRLAVHSPASLFSHAGAGHQLKLNKATPGDTASVLFQTGFSGRAEIGLAGSDALTVKVSADGTLFQTALSVAAASGAVTTPAGLRTAPGSAAAPGIAFADDTDTGLMRPAADQIGLVTGGVQRALLSSTALQLDVPLTGTAVQSDVTDTTDGRVFRMNGTRGPFGLGSDYGPGLTDFTAVQRGGFWRFTESTVTGYPTSASHFGAAIVARAGGSETGAEGGHMVLAARMSGATKTNQRIRLGQRLTNTGTMNWTEIYHSGSIVGTVADDGGVPNGAVIETGTNANGTYVRYADGTQMCWRTFSETIAIATAHLGGFRDLGRTWIFPGAFVAQPSIQAASGSAGASGAFAVNAGTTACSIFVTAVATQASAARVINTMATGRWKT